MSSRRGTRPRFILAAFLTLANFWQALRGPFSAVSKSTSATKYSFELGFNSSELEVELPPNSEVHLKFVKHVRMFEVLLTFIFKIPHVCNCCPKFINCDKHFRELLFQQFHGEPGEVRKYQNYILDSQIS